VLLKKTMMLEVLLYQLPRQLLLQKAAVTPISDNYMI